MTVDCFQHVRNKRISIKKKKKNVQRVESKTHTIVGKQFLN